MKSYFFPFILLLFFSDSLFGQNQHWSVGIEGGPGLKKFFVKNSLNKNYSLSYVLGGFAEYHVKGKFFLKADLLFENKGQKEPIIYTDLQRNITAHGKFSINANYIVIPVLAKFSFGKKIKLFFNAGPYAGLLVQYYAKFTGIPKSITPFRTVGGREKMSFLALGVTTGIGITIPLNEHIFINSEIRNNLGIYNIGYKDLPVRNITFNLVTGIGYRF